MVRVKFRINCRENSGVFLGFGLGLKLKVRFSTEVKLF